MKLAHSVPQGVAALPVSPLRTLSEIAELHRKGVITESEFDTLARAMMPEHVEREVEERITPEIDRIYRTMAKLLLQYLVSYEQKHKAE